MSMTTQRGDPGEPARQMSLFGAEVAASEPADVEGLLAGPGQVVRLGGTARISVVVEDAWRARALLAGFAERGLTGSQVATADGHIGVRTAFSAALAPTAARWLKGASTRPPEHFRLDGARLRLWFLAAGRLIGRPAPRGLLLALSQDDEAAELAWRPVRASLAQLGLPAARVGSRAGGPAYRIMGRRRLARFAELVGAPPQQAPGGVWPEMAPWGGSGVSRVSEAPVTGSIRSGALSVDVGP